VYTADEAFVTGTFGGIVPVRALDGREFAVTPADGSTRHLASLYAKTKDDEAASYIAHAGEI
jgi:branched-chain amino acid aminotransferase